MAIFKDGGSPEDEKRSKRFGAPKPGELHLLVFRVLQAPAGAVCKAYALAPDKQTDVSAFSSLFGVWSETGRRQAPAPQVLTRIYALDSWDDPRWPLAKEAAERAGAWDLPDSQSDPRDTSRWVEAALAAMEARVLEASGPALSCPAKELGPKRM